MGNLRKLVELKKEFLYDVAKAVSPVNLTDLEIRFEVEEAEKDDLCSKGIISMYLRGKEVYKASRRSSYLESTRVINFVEGEWVDSLLKYYSKTKESGDTIDFWVSKARKEGVDVEAHGFRIETISLSEESRMIKNIIDIWSRTTTTKRTSRSISLFKYCLFDAMCDRYNILVPAENLDEKLSIVCKELGLVDEDEEFFRLFFNSGFALKPSMY